MRTKTFNFLCAEHKEFGDNGWRIEGIPNADPLEGMGVAHDCLEHFPNGDMGVEDELLALGASLYVRTHTCNNCSLGANVAGDIPEILRHVVWKSMPLRPAPPTRPIPVEHEIDDLHHAVERNLRYDDVLLLNAYHRHAQDITGWLRTGYRRAARRYRGVERHHLFATFLQIEEAADKHLQYAELGDRLQVRLHWSRRGSSRVLDHSVLLHQDH